MTLTPPGTSKYYVSEALLGRNGTFLASLAAMCLLTVTSRHHEYRSHNSITFHHSAAIERRSPASEHHQVHGKHGTRVTVRNLFGNLPVRVKQRAVALEQKAEQDRLWHGFKRDIAGLLLAWQGAVSLRIRDGDNRVLLNYNMSNSAAARDPDITTGKPRSAQLSYMLNVLTQSHYITVDEWTAWVPGSASTSSVSIKGAISLDPAPSKQVQYISFGNRPLSAVAEHNELYEEINRLFALSSFGTIEDDADVDDLEKIRRQEDKRFKHDGYTTRQLKTRKVVDRHPMFHLRISLEGDSKFSLDQIVDDETMLQTIVEVMGAMVTQWLSVHHFRPRQPRRRQPRPDITSTSVSRSSREGASMPVESQFSSVLKPSDRNMNRLRLPRSSSTPAVRKSTQLRLSTSGETSEKLERRAFAQWSRIKSGKADFFGNLKADTALQTSFAIGDRSASNNLRKDDGFASFDMEPLQRGALDLPTASDQSIRPIEQSQAFEQEHDDTLLWTDPTTKKTYLLNARTGCVVPDLPVRPNTVSVVPPFAVSQRDQTKRLRLVPKSAGVAAANTPFLDNVLQTWDNPVFKPSERRIQQAFLEEPSLDRGEALNLHHRCSGVDMDISLNEVGTAGSGRLSKAGLQCAEVIAQVDKKFILVKMGKHRNDKALNDPPADLLVLIDQHAADERIKVETLLRDLCAPPANNTGTSDYQSKLGHRAQVTSILLEKPIQFTISNPEHSHFTTHAPRFSAWGILYDILTTPQSVTRPDKTQYLLSVTCLPPVISQRCKADPKLLISFLRSTVWKYAEDKHLPYTPSLPADPSDTHFTRRIATAPQGLLDMINSRACRSAIMFNDELSLEECRDLVAGLAACTFPFMCAHGRPSMVPLVKLGCAGEGVAEGVRGFGGGGVGGNQDCGRGEQTFVGKWKAWRG